MGNAFRNRVRETTTSTGTGAVTLALLAGYQRFASRLTVGDTCPYLIEDASGNWERGRGTYSAANTLTRTTVLESSNSDALVSFGAGTKTVTLTIPAPGADAQSTADWRTALGVSGLWAKRRLGVVAAHQTLANGSNTSAKEVMSRNSFRMLETIEADEPMAFEFDNFWLAELALGTSNATIEIGVEYPAGTNIGVWTFNGSAAGIASAGKTIRTDLKAPGVRIPAGADIVTRSWYANPDGILFFQTIGGGVNEMRYGGAGTITKSTTGSGVLTGGGSDYGGLGYHPSLVLGLTSKNCYVQVGDSRGRAYNDAPDDAYGATGEVLRSLPATTATINLAVDSSMLESIVGNMGLGGNYSIRAARIREFGTHVIAQIGVNDLYNNDRSVAQLQADFDTLQRNLGGMPIIYTTVGPVTDSSNGWADAAGQTVRAREGRRTAWNTFVRTLGTWRYIDTARAFDPTDSGKWPTNGTAGTYTSDGLHGQSLLYKLIQTNLTPLLTWVK